MTELHPHRGAHADLPCLPEAFVDSLSRLFPHAPRPVPLHAPRFRDADCAHVAARLDESGAETLEAILAATNAAGYQTRPLWTPLHRLPMYCDAPRTALPMTEAFADRVICLPSSPDLDDRYRAAS